MGERGPVEDMTLALAVFLGGIIFGFVGLSQTTSSAALRRFIGWHELHTPVRPAAAAAGHIDRTIERPAVEQANPAHHRRRRAAILFMDMVGFCRLTAADEEGTLARWKSLRIDIIERIVTDHRGRVVRVVGDQLLLEFPNTIDAVDCAVHLQSALGTVNADLPSSARMDFRIGVHLGVVIDDGNDLFGADVNVAARLEPLAEPGGIVVSAAIRDRLGVHGGLAYEDLGLLPLRNVPELVRAFRCRA